MIDRAEIETKAAEFQIEPANVQRDYVFGWLLKSFYGQNAGANQLVLKGGNCLRKGYFPNTRFSQDLDFSCKTRVDPDALIRELNAACGLVQQHTGVEFDLTQSSLKLQNRIDSERSVYDGRLYFKDFYGNPDRFKIRVSIDVTEFDQICLPPQLRFVHHPYSDGDACQGQIRCLKLEEMLAAKMNCLLQRCEVADLYDLVFAIFVNRDVEVDRREVLLTFLKKSIFGDAPLTARNTLLSMTYVSLRQAWQKYIIAPIQGLIEFDFATEKIAEVVQQVFSGFQHGETPMSRRFFSSDHRVPILQAGNQTKLLSLTYDGFKRTVEPYALAYKRRTDGVAREYLYVWDRTGGKSGPGIKSLLPDKVSHIQILDEEYQPRFAVELGRSEGDSTKGYFGKRSFASGTSSSRSSSPFRSRKSGYVYVIQCSYCGRDFRRSERNIDLKEHKDKVGNKCFGRRGYIVSQSFRS